MPNQPVFATLYTLYRFVYRQNSTLLYCTIKEIIILKIACFGVIYVPFSRVITRYYVYFFTRDIIKGGILKEPMAFKHNTSVTLSFVFRLFMPLPTCLESQPSAAPRHTKIEEPSLIDVEDVICGISSLHKLIP